MDGILTAQAMDWLLLVAAIVTSMLVFSLLWRILRAALGLIIPVAILLLVLKFGFGIAPADLLHNGMKLAQGLLQKIG